MSTLNPFFKKTKVRTNKFCNNNFDTEIFIELWDYNTNGDHKYIGKA